MRTYIALIHKDADSDFGVSFPDFPGCVTAGSTLQEAMAMAQEALAGHIDVMAEDGQAIPEPTTLDAIMVDPENRDGTAVLVQIPDNQSKTVRVNITLPEDVLQQIDTSAESKGLSRSGFIVQAAKKMMNVA
jgi:predicted RNase H-like HicB family nuclease